MPESKPSPEGFNPDQLLREAAVEALLKSLRPETLPEMPLVEYEKLYAAKRDFQFRGYILYPDGSKKFAHIQRTPFGEKAFLQTAAGSRDAGLPDRALGPDVEYYYSSYFDGSKLQPLGTHFISAELSNDLRSAIGETLHNLWEKTFRELVAKFGESNHGLSFYDALDQKGREINRAIQNLQKELLEEKGS